VDIIGGLVESMNRGDRPQVPFPPLVPPGDSFLQIRQKTLDLIGGILNEGCSGFRDKKGRI
jgi:hypothetical protein